MAAPAASQPRYWIVRNSAIHCRGVFARCDIPKGARIIEYKGEKITKAESLRRSKALLEKSRRTGCAAVYIFDLNKKHDLDGAMRWNTARLINHSCEPNCEAEQSRGRIWIVALKDIPKGTELSFNYGFDLENWKDHPCRCGTKKCVGYIAGKEYWAELKKLVRKHKAKEAPRLLENPAARTKKADEGAAKRPRPAGGRRGGARTGKRKAA